MLVTMPLAYSVMVCNSFENYDKHVHSASRHIQLAIVCIASPVMVCLSDSQCVARAMHVSKAQMCRLQPSS